MYCVHCGNPILDNSRFCSQCGKEQLIQKVEVKTEATIPTPNTLSSFKSAISKAAIIWYCAWVMLNLGFLLIGSDGVFESSNMNGIGDFFPFNDGGGIRDYDITEFLAYTLFPALIMFLAYLIKTNNKTNEASEDISEKQINSFDDLSIFPIIIGSILFVCFVLLICKLIIT